jgi:formate dehydrogenase assembly factor FdhD
VLVGERARCVSRFVQKAVMAGMQSRAIVAIGAQSKSRVEAARAAGI